MKSILPLALTLLVAACGAPNPSAPVAGKPASEGEAKPAPAADSCADVAALFDSLVKRKAEGWTERDALADLSARGEFTKGYVVDGVFGERFGPGGSAMARADTMAACRRLAEGGQLY